MSVNVRRATPADLSGIVESVAGLFGEDAGTRDVATNVNLPYEEGTAAFDLDDPTKLTLIADAGGQVAGHLLGLLNGPTPMRDLHVATLLSCYVFPEHRNVGVGGRMVDAFMAWARDHRADRLKVTAYAGNVDAVRFYKRHGFAPHTLTLERPVQR